MWLYLPRSVACPSAPVEGASTSLSDWQCQALSRSAMWRGKSQQPPVTEYRFHPTRRWRWDYAWPEHLVALEVQGGTWTRGRHTRGRGYAADIEKLNEGQLLGWTVIWSTSEQMASGQALAWVERALRAREIL